MEGRSVLKFAATIIVGSLVLAHPALAATCSPPPNTFSSGQTADATQVNNNFSNILTCANTLLAPLASPTFTGTTTFPGTNSIDSSGNLNIGSASVGVAK